MQNFSVACSNRIFSEERFSIRVIVAKEGHIQESERSKVTDTADSRGVLWSQQCLISV